MFYYTEEGWKPFKHKVSYIIPIVAYDNYLDSYDNVEGLEIEDITLTEEQLKRLDTIKNVDSVGVQDIETYVLRGVIEDQELVVLKEEIRAEETRQKLAKLIKWDELTTEEMEDLVDDFKDYEVGAFYIKGDIFSDQGQLYKVVSTEGHTAREEWKPSESHALYLPIAPPNVIAEFVQPFGGSGTYELGAKVIFEGAVYENILKGKLNVWSPTAYPQGWNLIDG